MSVTMVLYGLGLCRFIAFLLLGYSQRENEINARSNSKQACILVVLLITKKSRHVSVVYCVLPRNRSEALQNRLYFS